MVDIKLENLTPQKIVLKSILGAILEEKFA